MRTCYDQWSNISLLGGHMYARPAADHCRRDSKHKKKKKKTTRMCMVQGYIYTYVFGHPYRNLPLARSAYKYRQFSISFYIQKYLYTLIWVFLYTCFIRIRRVFFYWPMLYSFWKTQNDETTFIRPNGMRYEGTGSIQKYISLFAYILQPTTVRLCVLLWVFFSFPSQHGTITPTRFPKHLYIKHVPSIYDEKT